MRLLTEGGLLPLPPGLLPVSEIKYYQRENKSINKSNLENGKLQKKKTQK